jgi:hypothetical protein
MGKRSNFERIPRDFYPTPMEAVFPLVAQVTPPKGHRKTWFYEPCVGDGALVQHLHASNRFLLAGASDIQPTGEYSGLCSTLDALDLDERRIGNAHCIITNPPWDRKILHPMIERFSAMRPTWLLFDADWMHTKQSAPFMPWLRKVVSVGRVKWIPDSKHTGKDNCCWYLFDQHAEGPTEFVGRAG